MTNVKIDFYNPIFSFYLEVFFLYIAFYKFNYRVEFDNAIFAFFGCPSC